MLRIQKPIVDYGSALAGADRERRLKLAEASTPWAPCTGPARTSCPCGGICACEEQSHCSNYSDIVFDPFAWEYPS
jgi:hypothetical protein